MHSDRNQLDHMVDEGPGYQDWLAHHVSLDTVKRRIRQYVLTRASTKEQRDQVIRAARREFQLVESLHHPGILRAHTYSDHEFGPALIFDYDEGGVRLDLEQALRDHGGLRLSAVQDGVPRSLDDLVFASTTPAVNHRLDSVADFIGHLDSIEAELLAPETPAHVTPAEAQPGDTLAPFFSRALHRDASKRFNNAEQTRDAWIAAFARAEVKAPTSTALSADLARAVAAVDLDTPLSSLPLGAHAAQALDRLGVLTVQHLLEVPMSEVWAMRGVTNHTRRRIAIEPLRCTLHTTALEGTLRRPTRPV